MAKYGGYPNHAARMAANTPNKPGDVRQWKVSNGKSVKFVLAGSRQDAKRQAGLSGKVTAVVSVE